MALEITDLRELRRKASGAMYVAPERIYVTAGKPDDPEEDRRSVVCAADDPKAARLLVGAGCAIPATVAAQYGLLIGKGESDPASGDAAAADAEPAAEPEPEAEAEAPAPEPEPEPAAEPERPRPRPRTGSSRR